MSDLFTGWSCPVCNADVPKGEPHGEAHCCGNLQRRIWDLEKERDNYHTASLGMFDPVRVGQVVAQLQRERDEARQQAAHYQELHRRVCEQRDEAWRECERLREQAHQDAILALEARVKGKG